MTGELKANENENVEITVNGRIYERYAIETHFVKVGESYFDLFEKYVKPVYQPGDIVSSSEKVIALCQKRVVYRNEIKIGFCAKLLSKFASHPDTGIGVGETIKMQFAIDNAGLMRVLYAAAASAVTKLFGKRGVFYEIVGQQVSGLDGFYDHVWEEYRDMGILLPEHPKEVCDEIEEILGIRCMLVDANDFGQELLGKSNGITLSDSEAIALVKDNPAGQDRQCTPFILIREKIS